MAESRSLDYMLEDDDFAVIIGSDGTLKGIYVPENYDDDDYIPDPVVQLINTALGFDISDESNYPTIH